MKYCISCGMPMSKPEDFGCKDPNCKTCLYCSNEDCSVKPCKEIFEGGVEYFKNTLGGDRKSAEKITRYNMNHHCPYREGKNEAILQGEECTKEEFENFMKKLESMT